MAALADALGITYQRVVAPPDSATFRTCMAAVTADGWGAPGAGPQMGVGVPAAVAALHNAWEVAAEAYVGCVKVDGLRLGGG